MRKRREWTKGEIEYLLHNYREKKLAELGKELGRAKMTVHRKLKEVLTPDERKKYVTSKRALSMLGRKPKWYRNLKLPRPWESSDLSYILGCLFGDATINRSKKQILGIRLLGVNQDFAQEFKRAIERSCGFSPKVYVYDDYLDSKRPRKIYVCANSEVLGSYFSMFKHQSGHQRKGLGWEVPQEYFSVPLDMRKSLLQGYFDSEAYIGKYNIQIVSVCQKGIKSIKKLLASIGVSLSLYGPFDYSSGYSSERRPIYQLSIPFTKNDKRALKHLFRWRRTEWEPKPLD